MQPQPTGDMIAVELRRHRYPADATHETAMNAMKGGLLFPYKTLGIALLTPTYAIPIGRALAA